MISSILWIVYIPQYGKNGGLVASPSGIKKIIYRGNLLLKFNVLLLKTGKRTLADR